MPADLVFVNGTITPIDDRVGDRAPEAVAVTGRLISRAGSRADIRGETGPGTRVIDLGGRALLPGLNDNHTHPMSYGESLGQIDASPGAAPSLASLQGSFRRAATDGGAGSRGE